jgi:hypothetical protein
VSLPCKSNSRLNLQKWLRNQLKLKGTRKKLQLKLRGRKKSVKIQNLSLKKSKKKKKRKV